MRLIRITTNRPAYLKKFYHTRSQLKDQPYSIQHRALVDDCFGWADFWTHAFGKLGYEVWEPVGNAEPQQKAWAQEHSIVYGPDKWLTDIVTAQVKYFRPDILFVNDYHTYKKELLDHIRSECPSIRLVIGCCGAPYRDADVFKAYDVVLSNIPSLVEHFRNNGHLSEEMRHAFEPRILGKIQTNSQKTVPFSFVGSIVKAKGFHNKRERLLKHLVQNSCLQIWSDIQAPSIEIVEKTKPGLYGLAMYQMIHNSKVTFNSHIDISARFANNMRLYEATGVGTCLLTDWKENLSAVFEPDIEVVTYRSAEEAVEKVEYLLAHDNERCRIAEAGQRRTLQDHTFALRAMQLDEMIRSMI